MPVFERVFSDRLTPVLAYRCLVKEGDDVAPSFLLESVNNGHQQVILHVFSCQVSLALLHTPRSMCMKAGCPQ